MGYIRYMENANIANTIWKQINIMIKAACGMHKPQIVDNGLMVKVGGKLRFICITLNGRDLYDVVYFRLNNRTKSRIILATSNDVYCDVLSRVIDGMYTGSVD